MAVALLALAGCSTSHSGGAPSVDWSRIPENQRVMIRDAVGASSCARMQAAFDGSGAADVLAYLDGHMKNAGCY